MEIRGCGMMIIKEDHKIPRIPLLTGNIKMTISSHYVNVHSAPGTIMISKHSCENFLIRGFTFKLCLE